MGKKQQPDYISNNPFKEDIEIYRQFRGYNMEQVDRYIYELNKEYNRLHGSYTKLEEQNEKLSAENEYYRSKADVIARIMIENEISTDWQAPVFAAQPAEAQASVAETPEVQLDEDDDIVSFAPFDDAMNEISKPAQPAPAAQKKPLYIVKPGTKWVKDENDILSESIDDLLKDIKTFYTGTDDDGSEPTSKVGGAR